MDRSSRRRPNSPTPQAQGPRHDPGRAGDWLTSRLRQAHAAGLAAILAAVSGLNTLPNDFAYDDHAILRQNPLVTESGHTLDVFRQHYWEQYTRMRGETRTDLLYRPLTVLTYRMNHIAGGLNPFGYHLVNVLLHAFVSALVTVLAARLGCSIAGSLVAGALFAVMPIHTEAVANVVGRAEVLTALWVLLAALFALRVRFDSLASGLGWTLAAAIASFAAILSKENGATAFVLVPLLAAFAPAGLAARKRIQVILVTSAVLAIPAAAYAVLRYQATAGQMASGGATSPLKHMMADATAAERFWGAWQTFGLYVAKTFWPRILCMDYSYKAFALADSPVNIHVAIGVASLAGLIAACMIWWRRGHRVLALAGLAILIAYLPVSNTVFLRTLFAERVWYLPSAFVAIVLGGIVSTWAVSHHRLAVVSLVALVATIAGLARTWVRNAEWHDNGTLFAAAYRDHPNSAHVLYSYGQWLVNQGEVPRGLALITRCTEIAPDAIYAYAVLGRVYAQLGDYRQAVAALQTARMKKPDDIEIQQAFRDAADRLAATERTRLDQLRHRCETQPASLPLFLEWTDALREVGRTTEALSLFTSKEPRFGRSADFQYARAVALMLAGKQDEGIEAYRTASTLDPKNVEILVELAIALLDRHRPEDLRQAGELIDQAHRIAPGHPRVLLARAEWLDMNGQHQQAVAIYRQLLRILPPGPLRSTIQARLEVSR